MANARTAPAVRRNSYLELFNKVVNVVTHDYAGYPERAGWNHPELYSDPVITQGRGTDTRFLTRVRHYLANLGDPTLRLESLRTNFLYNWDRGFDVRAMEDQLVVTRLHGETRLAPGDRVTELLGHPVAQLRAESAGRGLPLYGDTPEREDWEVFLRESASMRVRHADGSEEDFEAGRYPYAPEPTTVACETDAGGEAIVRLDSFEDPDAVNALLEAHAREIAASDRLVVDVRRCAGGYIDAVFPLLPYLFPEDATLAEVLGDTRVYRLYTRRTCHELGRAWRAQLREAPDDATRAELAASLDELSGLAGVGYRLEDGLPPELLARPVPGRAGGRRVVVLADTTCRDEGEVFVKAARSSPNVTVVGRPTRGTYAYPDRITVALDDTMTLTYAVSATRAAHEEPRVTLPGVPVDVHVPWTPEELSHDVILERAREVAAC